MTVFKLLDLNIFHQDYLADRDLKVCKDMLEKTTFDKISVYFISKCFVKST